MSSSLPAQIDGHSVPIAAFQPRKGVVPPTVIEGREPLRPDEMALGSLTMRTLGKRLHDTVTFNAGPQPRQLRVVGRVVLNEGNYDSLITPRDWCRRASQPLPASPRNLGAVPDLVRRALRRGC